MAEWSLPKKARKSNFSTDEVDVLVDSVKERYGILYGKYAKRATNRWIRHKAWMEILKKVNGVSIEKRTLQEVKNKWKKCQYAMKEKVSRGVLADDSSVEDVDSMPLQERLSKVAAQEKISAAAVGQQQVLKSQPLSPTKLKVTRHSPKVAAKPAEPPHSPVNEEMCLRWNSHHSNMQTAFPSILSKEQYVDVTLAAEGKTLKCHRLILSSCSPYFEEILSGISPFQHPVLFMRDIPFWILKSLCDFMYAGEVHIFQNKLEELLTVAEALKIKGLAGKSSPPENREERNKNENHSNNHNTTSSNNISGAREARRRYHQEKEKAQTQPNPPPPPPPPPPPLQKKPVFSRSNNYESTSHDYEDDLLDPLDLLEPLYEEAAEEKQPSTVVKPKENKFHQYQPVKKQFTRKLRKRKFSEQQREPSPPPVFSFRKGTRSRPNVKIPKYYHSDYGNNPPKPASNAQTDPLLEVDEIKTEPIDVEDNNLVDNYSDEDHQYVGVENSVGAASCESPPVVITGGAKSSSPQRDRFKKIKLSKPIITEVHTIEEANTTTPGGLEVIKITMQQSDVCDDKTATALETEPTVEPPPSEDAEPPVLEAEVTENPPESREPVGDGEKITEEETVTNVAQEEEEEEEEEEEIAAVGETAAETEDIEDVLRSDEPAEGANSFELDTKADEFVYPPEGASHVDDPPKDTECVTNTEIIEESIKVIEETETTEEEQTFQQEFQIQDVRSTALDEPEEDTEEERRTTSLNHLEQEAMNVANAINMENQAGPPDIE